MSAGPRVSPPLAPRTHTDLVIKDSMAADMATLDIGTDNLPKTDEDTGKGSHQCLHCKAPALLQCAGCAPHFDAWYCDKNCQVAGRRDHKLNCKSAQLYGRNRTLQPPQDRQKLDEIAREYRITYDRAGLEFLYTIPVANRTLGIADDSVIQQIILDDLARLERQTTLKGYEDILHGIWGHLEEKYKKVYVWEVPFGHRPLTESMDGKVGIRIYAQDYELISPALYDALFSDKKVCLLNPWSRENKKRAIEQREKGEEREEREVRDFERVPAQNLGRRF